MPFNFDEPESTQPGETKAHWELTKTIKYLKNLKDDPRRKKELILGIIEKIRETEYMFGWEPIDVTQFGISEDEISQFIQNDRYMTANMLRDELMRTRNKLINAETKKIKSIFAKGHEQWFLFTKRGCKRHE